MTGRVLATLEEITGMVSSMNLHLDRLENPQPKTIRGPSEYNGFMSNAIKELRADKKNKDKPYRWVFMTAIALWHEKKAQDSSLSEIDRNSALEKAREARDKAQEAVDDALLKEKKRQIVLTNEKIKQLLPEEDLITPPSSPQPSPRSPVRVLPPVPVRSPLRFRPEF